YGVLAGLIAITVGLGMVSWFEQGLPTDPWSHGVPGFLIKNWYLLLCSLLLVVLPVRPVSAPLVTGRQPVDQEPAVRQTDPRTIHERRAGAVRPLRPGPVRGDRRADRRLCRAAAVPVLAPGPGRARAGVCRPRAALGAEIALPRRRVGRSEAVQVFL